MNADFLRMDLETWVNPDEFDLTDKGCKAGSMPASEGEKSTALTDKMGKLDTAKD